ncbi:MAG: alpha/beta fold hydrolase, partial [Myxococcota bacterium]
MITLLAAVAHAGPVDVGGYFRVMARPDTQGGTGRLGYWNLYGRLMNEGPYGMLDFRYDVWAPDPGSDAPWTSVHARIEGGSIQNADPANGNLGQFRLSQTYVKTGNVLLPDVVWQVGTLEYFFGDLGLYDIRPATLFYDTVGATGLYRSPHLEVLAGVGDSGFALRGSRYDALPTAGGAIRVRALESGPADGPPILLLHGWGVSSYLWRHNILALASAGHRVVAVDLPGHGLSDAPEGVGAYTLERFTA